MTFEQADVLADVFNMLVGRGKPSAFVEEHRDGTCSVRLSNGTGANHFCMDAGDFSKALREWIDP